MSRDSKGIKFAFFGGSEVSVHTLNELKERGFMPSLVITTPDKPKGREQILTSPLAKVWAEENGVRVLQPAKLRDGELLKELKKGLPPPAGGGWDVFVVASYGKIIPDEILDLPKYKSINMHPSLLPELRGPSPIITMILEDKKETGVTIMLMDAEMDHGPILMQEFVSIDEWPTLGELEEKLAKIGGKLLAEVIPEWIRGNIDPQEQEHDKATFSKMFKKEDVLIDLNGDDYLNYRKILAFERLKPYFIKNGKRVVINKAEFKDGKLKILRVTPEGKKEQDYKS